MSTRSEHLDWCKQRAIEYVDAGDLPNALASMTSDLGKHPETEGSVSMASELGMMLMLNGDLSSPRAMRDFIDGFN